MLALTDQAASAIRTLTTQPDMPDQTGLRIAPAVDEGGTPTFALSLTTSPEPKDQVVESEGARVFLDPDVAPVLDDKTLDAQVDEQGRVEFQLFE